MRKKIIITFSLILCVVVILRQVGLLDINLYKSQIGTNQSIITSKGTDSKEKYSFHMVFKNQDKILGEHIYDDGKSLPINIESNLLEVNYSGNYRLPFFKSFKVKYKCDIRTLNSTSDVNVSGKIEGEINAKFIGLCSVRKVKAVILEEITKSVMNGLPGNLQN